MSISPSDQKFINQLLGDELEYELMEELDKRLKDPDFRDAYDAAVKKKYSNKQGVLLGYVPMVVLLLLIILGTILIFIKI